MTLSIIPRLNYKYTFSDVVKSVSGLFKKKWNIDELKLMFQADEVFFSNHARTGMRMAFNSLGFGKNATIGLMGFNCLTVMNAIKSAGYNLLFVDVTDDFQLDMVDFYAKVDKMDALVINHMFGIPNASVIEIRERYPQLPIVEDCAHSFMTKLNDKLTGSFGDIAVFSYGRGKFPSVGDGGFVIINNKDYRDAFVRQYKALRTTTLHDEVKNVVLGILLSFLRFPFLYKNIALGMFKGMDNKKDIVGKYSTKEQGCYKSSLNLFLSKLKIREQMLAKQKKNGEVLKSAISESVMAFKGDYNYFMLPIYLEKRDDFIRYCYDNGVEVGKHFSKTIQWAKSFGYVEGDCPGAEKIADHIVTLPCHYAYNVRKLLNLL